MIALPSISNLFFSILVISLRILYGFPRKAGEKLHKQCEIDCKPRKTKDETGLKTGGEI
jgi:hypothetical protein